MVKGYQHVEVGGRMQHVVVAGVFAAARIYKGLCRGAGGQEDVGAPTQPTCLPPTPVAG